MKRAFIIHRWDGTPQSDWYPWLKAELEKQGFTVTVPAMPHTEAPSLKEWVPFLADVVGEIDEQTYFIGHSVGCQTVMRYLESLPSSAKTGNVAFVAGWFHLVNLADKESEAIARPWIETPIDFEKVKYRPNNFYALFSDNDEWVPLTEEQLFKQRLNAQTQILHGKGHFTGDDGVQQIPELREKFQC